MDSSEAIFPWQNYRACATDYICSSKAIAPHSMGSGALSLFSVGDRVWVTSHLNVEGIPGVGEVRKIITEWTDLGEELNGYWEISYLLKNTRVAYSQDCVFATELEALTALAADFRKQAIAQASVLCRRMRALGMNITTKELIENLAEFT